MQAELCDGSSFRFVVHTYGKKYSTKEQMEVIERFKEFPLWDTCPVDLSNPKRTFCVLVDIGVHRGKEVVTPRKVYFALKVLHPL